MRTVSPTSTRQDPAHGLAQGHWLTGKVGLTSAHVRPATGCAPPAVFRSPSGRKLGPAARIGDDHLPFISGPQQVGAQDDGDVTGRHLVGVTGLCEFSKELDEVPEDERVGHPL